MYGPLSQHAERRTDGLTQLEHHSSTAQTRPPPLPKVHALGTRYIPTPLTLSRRLSCSWCRAVSSPPPRLPRRRSRQLLWRRRSLTDPSRWREVSSSAVCVVEDCAAFTVWAGKSVSAGYYQQQAEINLILPHVVVQGWVQVLKDPRASGNSHLHRQPRPAADGKGRPRRR